MTIEHAPSTNGHLKQDDATRREPIPSRASEPERDAASAPAPHRRVPLDLRGLLFSALVGAGVALILRRMDRGASD
ncbi:MAG: hypothetical protein M3P30_13500 [Chloroflexota bacterium]|nr:hypothetical protein [Chloroflexota bacterium]